MVTDGARTESHPLESWDYGEYGWWDNLYAEVAIVESSEEVVEGVSTAFACGQALSWELTVFDGVGAEADCVVGGADPESLSSDCPVWE